MMEYIGMWTRAICNDRGPAAPRWWRVTVTEVSRFDPVYDLATHLMEFRVMIAYSPMMLLEQRSHPFYRTSPVRPEDQTRATDAKSPNLWRSPCCSAHGSCENSKHCRRSTWVANLVDIDVARVMRRQESWLTLWCGFGWGMDSNGDGDML